MALRLKFIDLFTLSYGSKLINLIWFLHVYISQSYLKWIVQFWGKVWLLYWVGGVFCECFISCILQAWRKPATTACIYLLPMGKISINWVNCVVLHCTSRTVYRGFSHAWMAWLFSSTYSMSLSNCCPLSHSISLFPDLPVLPFHLRTRKWSSAPVYSCMWTQMEGKMGEAWEWG